MEKTDCDTCGLENVAGELLIAETPDPIRIEALRLAIGIGLRNTKDMLNTARDFERYLRGTAETLKTEEAAALLRVYGGIATEVSTELVATYLRGRSLWPDLQPVQCADRAYDTFMAPRPEESD